MLSTVATGPANVDAQGAISPGTTVRTDLRPVGSVEYDGYSAEEYCGTATCTIYFTRESTRRLDEDMGRRKDSTMALMTGYAGTACAVAGGVAGSLVTPGPGTAGGIAAGAGICGTAAAVKTASLYDHLGDAAANGHCFAVRKPRWTSLGTVAAFYGSDYLVRTTPGRCLD